ncbi:MAG: mannose-1-phosphate guanylyltransferase [Gemmatimonadota bacterium]
MSAPAPTWAVVLAGGGGTRFWPASTRERPKQLLPLAGERPLVVETVERAVAVAGEERVLIVTGPALAAACREILPELGEEHYLVEPRPRGTGPALAWAAHHLSRAAPGAVMISMHADHLIEPLDEFRRTVRRAAGVARDGERLYCIGVRPDRPETAYGYVRLGRRSSPHVYEAREFVEKPDADTAARYAGSEEYLWNSGIFAWKVSTFLEALRGCAPEIASALARLDEDDVPGFFEDVESVAVDVAVMERAPAVGVVEATFRWDDVGVWTALARTHGTDPAGNTVVGPVSVAEARENIVWAEGGRVTLLGVDGLVVVRSGEETLVMPRKRANELRELLRRLYGREVR